MQIMPGDIAMTISELARLCIVGSDKGGAAALAGEGSLEAAALRELETLPRREGSSGTQEETARKCLLASGIAALHSVQGIVPQPNEDVPDLLKEVLPEGPNLRELFVRRYPHEVLSWLHRHGRRLPAAFLPEAVAWAASGRHDEIWTVLGATGEQLCRDNPAWKQLLADCAGVAAEQGGTEDLALWEGASLKARGVLLQRLRERDPQAGRELAAPLLQKQFSKNGSLLYAFLRGLSAEDIPLLEECSGKTWQGAGLHPAKLLLSLLPESAVSRELAGEDCLSWKGRKLVLTADIFASREENDPWKDWAKDLPEEDCLMLFSLDWWLARSGRDCADFVPAIARSGLLLPIGMRIFLENRKDWLNLLLQAAFAETTGSDVVHPGLGFLGTLAAVMLPPEEVERWLRVLLRHDAPHCKGSDTLAAAMLLHAPFPVSRELWSLYVDACGRRLASCNEAVVQMQGKFFRFSVERGFSALWGEEQKDYAPEVFQNWTVGKFRSASNTYSVLHHFAWEMPLDELERLLPLLQLPAEDSLFEQSRKELGDIYRFRAENEQS